MDASLESIQAPLKRSLPLLFAVAMVSVVVVLLMARSDFPSVGEDYDEYRNLILNHWELVHQPFSSRFLHPMTVLLLMRVTGLSDRSAVMGLAIAELLVIAGLLTWILAKMRVNPLFLLLILPGQAFVESVRLAYMPDLFYTTLLLALFLLLQYDQLIVAAFMVFVLFCARESTMVLGVILAGLSAFYFPRRAGTAQASAHFNRRLAVMFLAALVIGFAFNKFISGKSASNMHHLSGLMYLVGKVPFNFLKNVAGVEPWVDTLTATEGDHPIYQWPLPHWVRMGSIHRVGIAEFSAAYPLRWLTDSLCIFGVLLTVVAREFFDRIVQVRNGTIGRFKNSRAVIAGIKSRIFEEPFYIQVALLYGLVSFIVVPILGTAVARYVVYAWPAFWIAGMKILQQRYLADRRVSPLPLTGLLALHFGLVWMPALVADHILDWRAMAVLFTVSVLMQIAAWIVLTRGFAVVYRGLP